MRHLTNFLAALAIACFLCMLAPPADAQNFTAPLPACADRPPLATLPVPVAPSGIPEPLRLSLAPADSTIPVCKTVIEVNAVGGAAAFWCGAAGKAPELSLYAVRWSVVTPDMVTDFMQLGLPGNSRERIRAMQAKYQTTNVWDMCDVWGPARDRINAAMPMPMPMPTPPPAPLPGAWKVAPFGTVATTRPAFSVTNGKRDYGGAGRATVGAACDCSAPIIEGPDTYCMFAGAVVPTSVTACSKP